MGASALNPCSSRHVLYIFTCTHGSLVQVCWHVPTAISDRGSVHRLTPGQADCQVTEREIGCYAGRRPSGRADEPDRSCSDRDGSPCGGQVSQLRSVCRADQRTCRWALFPGCSLLYSASGHARLAYDLAAINKTSRVEVQARRCRWAHRERLHSGGKDQPTGVDGLARKEESALLGLEQLNLRLGAPAATAPPKRWTGCQGQF